MEVECRPAPSPVPARMAAPPPSASKSTATTATASSSVTKPSKSAKKQQEVVQHGEEEEQEQDDSEPEMTFNTKGGRAKPAPGSARKSKFAKFSPNKVAHANVHVVEAVATPAADAASPEVGGPRVFLCGVCVVISLFCRPVRAVHAVQDRVGGGLLIFRAQGR